MVVPFQPTGVTCFNSFFDNTILNIFFSGLLAFLILLELENVTNVFMYRTHTINKRSIDGYILFSRVSSMRGILRTLSGLEYPAREISTEPSRCRPRWTTRWLCSRSGDNGHGDAYPLDQGARDEGGGNSKTVVIATVDSERSLTLTDFEQPHLPAAPEKRHLIRIPMRNGVPHPRVNLMRVFTPIIIRLAILLLELAAIYSSSNISDEVLAGRSFNVRLTEGNSAFNSSQPGNFQCQEFISSARGVEQNGSVLLCIGSEETFEFQAPNHTIMHFRFDPSQNQLEYVVEDRIGARISVYVRVLINLIDDDALELAPLRPDLAVDGNYSKNVVQMVMHRAMNKLGFDVSAEQIEESVDEENVIEYRYGRHFGRTGKLEMADALLSELRKLSLDLNVTQEGEEDALYVFGKGRGYFRHENAVIAIVSRNRVAQGWLTIAWVSVLVVRVIAQQFLTSFDELAYVALKKVHGADISVGPLAKVEKKEALFIGKFSDGRVGHIGYRAANERQDRVDNFYGCDAVLGSSGLLRRQEGARQKQSGEALGRTLTSST